MRSQNGPAIGQAPCKEHHYCKTVPEGITCLANLPCQFSAGVNDRGVAANPPDLDTPGSNL